MQQTPLQTIGYWTGSLGIIVPGMIVSGFMPELNVLPFFVWWGIAILCGIIGGFLVGTPRIAAAIAGGVIGAGALIGVAFYVDVRSLMIESDTYFSFELMIGALIGAAPGLALFGFIAKVE